MATQKIEIELNIPDSWEFVKYRCAKVGEFSIDAGRASYQSPKQWTIESAFRQFIVRQKRKWRPATIEDVVRAIRGEVVEARFRDDPRETSDWQAGVLFGCKRDYHVASEVWWISRNDKHPYCEVLE